MKRTKKLLTLVLAMLMAFSIMAVTAAAKGNVEHEHIAVCSAEGIMPRKPAMDCYKCHVPMNYEESKFGEVLKYRMICPNYAVCGNATGWISVN